MNNRKDALLWAFGAGLGSAAYELIADSITGELAVDTAVQAARRGGLTFVLVFAAFFAFVSWRNRSNR